MEIIVDINKNVIEVSKEAPVINLSFEKLQEYVKEGNNISFEVKEEDEEISINADIPTKTSDLSNDSGYITAAEAPVQPSDIPTKTSDLSNDSGFLTTETDPIFTASEAASFASGDKSKLDNIEANANKYTHPTTHPQSIIDQTATETATPVDANRFHFWDTVGLAWKAITFANLKTALQASFDLIYSKFSGSYNDLSDKPTIPDIDFETTNLECFAVTESLGVWSASLRGGRIGNDNIVTTVIGGKITIQDDATNYIEVTTGGGLTTNTTGFTEGNIPLYEITLASGALVGTLATSDKRTRLRVGGGGGGGATVEIYSGEDVTPLPARTKNRYKGYLQAIDNPTTTEVEIDFNDSKVVNQFIDEILLISYLQQEANWLKDNTCEVDVADVAINGFVGQEYLSSTTKYYYKCINVEEDISIWTRTVAYTKRSNFYPDVENEDYWDTPTDNGLEDILADSANWTNGIYDNVLGIALPDDLLLGQRFFDSTFNYEVVNNIVGAVTIGKVLIRTTRV
jgi:hypothetical protein